MRFSLAVVFWPLYNKSQLYSVYLAGYLAFSDIRYPTG